MSEPTHQMTRIQKQTLMKTFDCHGQIIPEAMFTSLNEVEIRGLTLSAGSSRDWHDSDLEADGVESIELVLHLLSVVQWVVMLDIVDLVSMMESVSMSLDDLNSIGDDLGINYILLVKTKISLVESIVFLDDKGCFGHSSLHVTLREPRNTAITFYIRRSL